MSPLFVRIACAVLLTTLPLPLAAQDAALATGNNQELMRFAANNAAFDKRVEAQAKRLYPKMFTDCPVIDQAVRQLPTAYGELVFTPSSSVTSFPAPTEGLWAEHVKVRACNKIRQINMLSVGRRDAEPLLLALLPGDTKADPATQRDTERVGATTISKADGGTCSDTATATTTRFLGYSQKDATGLTTTDTGNGWFEEWTYRFCQKDVPVQMAFLPNENGAFDVKARMADQITPQVPAAKPPVVPAVTPVKTP